LHCVFVMGEFVCGGACGVGFCWGFVKDFCVLVWCSVCRLVARFGVGGGWCFDRVVLLTS